MKKYYCFFPVRDGVRHIEEVLQSLLGQTVRPDKIIIVDDGSTDGTTDVLHKYREMHPDLIEVIRTENKVRDYKRLVSLWNMCIKKDYEYHFITAGDLLFEPQYAETILKTMDNDSNIVIASGDYHPFVSQSPHGGGRFVRQDFFFKTYDNAKYTEIIGYESEILIRAMMQNKKAEVINKAHFVHLDELGHGHNFVEFGYGMRSLGYHPIWSILRCIYDIKYLGYKNCFNMFKSYITYKPQKTGYYSLFPDDLRKFIHDYQSVTVKLTLLSLVVKIGIILGRRFVKRKKKNKIRKYLYDWADNYKRNQLKKLGIEYHKPIRHL